MNNDTTRTRSTTFHIELNSLCACVFWPDHDAMMNHMEQGLSEDAARSQCIDDWYEAYHTLAHDCPEVRFCDEHKLEYTIWFANDAEPVFLLEMPLKTQADFFAANFTRRPRAIAA